ncbi:MAG: hypothetical protein IJZ16_01435 [Clostridia bacterium]|nr:hypothetical protein [Clostridia bacterium]
MFCVLSVKERNRSFFEKLFGRFMTDEYEVNTIPVFRGAPFFTLDITTNKKEIDWENVIFSVGRCASRLLVDDEIYISENSGVSIFKSNILYYKMMENTFLNILKNSNQLHTISISDKKGENTDFVKRAAPYASQLIISTENKEKFSNICDDIIDLTGMCPVVKSQFDDSKIKINTDNWTMTIQGEGGNINISDGVDFNMPEIYEKLLPEKIDKYDFCSALYELCGVFTLGESVFDTIIVNNEKKSVQDIHFS